MLRLVSKRPITPSSAIVKKLNRVKQHTADKAGRVIQLFTVQIHKITLIVNVKLFPTPNNRSECCIVSNVTKPSMR